MIQTVGHPDRAYAAYLAAIQLMSRGACRVNPSLASGCQLVTQDHTKFFLLNFETFVAPLCPR